ncbi:gram-negative bacteria-binding protein 2 [Ceratitis capitata]|uniref:gram-negative bacteria-binding protein 2 n=1 Tax=Ceratitis capitata TaxID=7213 RepID=UPI000329AC2C|nr:gram-negative bacteria-binding protein 2 [Ceratitis capitata]
MRLYSLNLVFFWIYFCCDITVNCYEIPQINLEKLQHGFRVSIPFEHGTSLVVFHVFINGQYSIMDLVTEKTNNSWIKEHPEEELYENDEVRVQVVAGHTHGLIFRSDNFKISKNSTIIYTPTTQEDIQAAIKTSETRANFKKLPLEKIFKPDDLIFEDNFESFDTSKWTHDIFMPSNFDGYLGDFTMYTDDEARIFIDNHTLRITPSLSERHGDVSFELPRCTSTPCAKDENANCFYKPTTDRHSGFPAPVISARISTKKTFSFTYGRIEVFAKLPLGAWLFPSVMLEPDNLNCDNRKQLRIAFATSDGLNFHFSAGAVKLVKQSAGEKNFTRISEMADISNIRPYSYHNFTMVWTSKRITLYMDSEKIGYIVNNGEYDEPYHIVLGVSAGGHLEFPDSPLKPWRDFSQDASFQFDNSFKDCCLTQGGPKCLDKNQEEKTCSKTWTPHATMAIKYVRVYAV